MDYESLQQSYERLENKIERLNHLDNVEYLIYAAPAVILGVSVGFLVFDTGSGEIQGQQKFEPELTEYQQSYVDCPHRHIYICTRMSKLGTEPVSFVRTRDSRIFLRYSRSDRLVARTPQNGTTGYLINIDRDYYADQQTSQIDEPFVNETGESTSSDSVENTTEAPNTTQQSNLTAGNQTSPNSTQTN